jgi:molecular chaperone DnaK
MANDNRTLGRFMLDGILPAPRGMPQVEVTFDIDANGILSVKALDKGTGKEQKITITVSSGLSKDEIEKMRKEGEAHAAEDARRKEEVEIRNTADNLAYMAEKTLRDNKDKIPEALNKDIEGKVTAVREAMKGSNVDAIKQASQTLNDTMQKVGQEIYKQQQPPPQSPPPGSQPPPPPGGKKDDGTVDGEFHEV